jgi:hypothetical protein
MRPKRIRYASHSAGLDPARPTPRALGLGWTPEIQPVNPVRVTQLNARAPRDPTFPPVLHRTSVVPIAASPKEVFDPTQDRAGTSAPLFFSLLHVCMYMD